MTAEPHDDQQAARAAAQRRRSLQTANQVRRARAELKRELARHAHRPDGYQLLARLLERQEQVVMNMSVGELLQAVRGIGAVRTRVILRAADIRWPGVRVRELSPRQRDLIAQLLRTLRI